MARIKEVKQRSKKRANKGKTILIERQYFIHCIMTDNVRVALSANK
jgi:hypothetical protein